MLKSVDSFSLTLHERLHTFDVTGKSVLVRDSTSLSWEGPCEIRSVNAVYNTSCVFVKLTNDTGHVLEIGKDGKSTLKEVLKLSICPTAVYGTAEFLIYNDKKSCHLYHLNSGKLSVKLNHQLFGYECRTKSYIFKSVDGLHFYLTSTKFHSYKSLCLNSVSSLPIAWVTILSAHALVLGTSLNRVMYVYDGIIKSHFRLSHPIEHINPVSEIVVAVSGCGISTDLSVPVLGPVKVSEQDDEGMSAAIQQLVLSCDNHISKQLNGLNKLHRRHERKVEFLAEIWNKLFELNGISKIEQTVSDDHTPKRRKTVGSFISSNFTGKQLPYQIPIWPNTSTETSSFLESDRTVTSYCTDKSKHAIVRLQCDLVECRKLPRSSLVDRTYDIKVTPEFRENLRKMFAEALVFCQDSRTVDSLAHLSNMVLAIDNR